MCTLPESGPIRDQDLAKAYCELSKDGARCTYPVAGLVRSKAFRATWFGKGDADHADAQVKSEASAASSSNDKEASDPLPKRRSAANPGKRLGAPTEASSTDAVTRTKVEEQPRGERAAKAPRREELQIDAGASAVVTATAPAEGTARRQQRSGRDAWPRTGAWRRGVPDDCVGSLETLETYYTLVTDKLRRASGDLREQLLKSQRDAAQAAWNIKDLAEAHNEDTIFSHSLPPQTHPRLFMF